MATSMCAETLTDSSLIFATSSRWISLPLLVSPSSAPQIGGMPSSTNPYLFNGDFVDRGSFSLEVVLTLLAFKLALPDGLYMTRGNHETKGMNVIYGFEGEVKHKYDMTAMRIFSEVFQWLPLAAVIEDAVFVVHGGLSTMNEGCVTLKEIEELKRDREPSDSSLMSDLLWSGKYSSLCLSLSLTLSLSNFLSLRPSASTWEKSIEERSWVLFRTGHYRKLPSNQ
jgi:hypothetical protein